MLQFSIESSRLYIHIYTLIYSSSINFCVACFPCVGGAVFNILQFLCFFLLVVFKIIQKDVTPPTCRSFGCEKRSIRIAPSRNMSVTASLRFGLWSFSADRLSNRNIDTSCKQLATPYPSTVACALLEFASSRNIIIVKIEAPKNRVNHDSL